MQDETKTTMAVHEMAEILGLKKTESYWLIHKQKFQTVPVNGKLRVVIASFEEWYRASQLKKPFKFVAIYKAKACSSNSLYRAVYRFRVAPRVSASLPIMILIISSFVAFMPSFPRMPMLRIVWSTPFAISPSPA